MITTRREGVGNRIRTEMPDWHPPGSLPEMPLDATIMYQPTDADGIVVAHLAGELDLDRADDVRDSLNEASGLPGCHYLQVDVSGLAFIDSYGLGVLVSVRNTAAARGVTLSLKEPSPPVRKAIEVTGLGDVFSL